MPGSRLRLAAALLAAGFALAACTTADDPVVDQAPPQASESPPGGGRSSGFGDAAEGGIEVPVDEAEILSGGPPPDGIPPIDEPKFVDPADVDYLVSNEPVLAVELDGVSKAYPIRIMTWHEIVNDEFGGTPVVVTYCPLCNTGIAFLRPTFKGELLDFGTSGKLYHSNLVMYDRQTQTYWAQATGQAILGELVPRRLEFVPARLLSWGDWLAANPNGSVLSIDTGFGRDYGRNPYAGYDGTDDPFLFTGEVDPRLAPTAHVLGIAQDGVVTAVPLEEMASIATGDRAVAHLDVGRHGLAVFWKAGTSSALDASEIAEGRDVGAIAAYVPLWDGMTLTFRSDEEGIWDEQTGSLWSISGTAEAGPLEGAQLEVALAIPSFWFDWAAFHPDTEIWSAP